MGNKRATYFIGTIIAAFSITLAFAAIIPAIQDATTESTALNPLGHVTLVVYDPNGNVVAYRQGDNFVTTATINAFGANIFDGTATTFDAFDSLALCKGASGGTQVATAQGDTACTEEALSLRVSGAGGGSSESLFAGTNYVRVLAGTFTILLADDNETFDELAIFDTLSPLTGNMFSVATFASFVAQTGGLVSGTYTVTITG